MNTLVKLTTTEWTERRLNMKIYRDHQMDTLFFVTFKVSILVKMGFNTKNRLRVQLLTSESKKKNKFDKDDK